MLCSCDRRSAASWPAAPATFQKQLKQQLTVIASQDNCVRNFDQFVAFCSLSVNAGKNSGAILPVTVNAA
jgi:hypothetical protein